MDTTNNIDQVLKKIQPHNLSTIIPLVIPISIEFYDYEGICIFSFWQKPIQENKLSNSVARGSIRELLCDSGIQAEKVDQIERDAFEKYLAMRYIDKENICAYSAKEMEAFFDRCDALITATEPPKELNSLDLYYRSAEAEEKKINILQRKQEIEKQYAVLFNYITLKLAVYQNKAFQREKNYAIVNAAKNSKRIFIIHGHDESKRRELETLLKERFGLEPIVLSNNPNQGLTIIEKFEKYASECSYAFALFTPDDIIQNDDHQYFQARPNVIFELGWFYANLGRSRVCILDKSSDKSKIFSDLQGVMRIQFAENISEKIIDIERELRSVGIIN